jgi:hypothetical protein
MDGQHSYKLVKCFLIFGRVPGSLCALSWYSIPDVQQLDNAGGYWSSATALFPGNPQVLRFLDVPLRIEVYLYDFVLFIHPPIAFSERLSHPCPIQAALSQSCPCSPRLETIPWLCTCLQLASQHIELVSYHCSAYRVRHNVRISIVVLVGFKPQCPRPVPNLII